MLMSVTELLNLDLKRLEIIVEVNRLTTDIVLTFCISITTHDTDIVLTFCISITAHDTDITADTELINLSCLLIGFYSVLEFIIISIYYYRNCKFYV